MDIYTEVEKFLQELIPDWRNRAAFAGNTLQGGWYETRDLYALDPAGDCYVSIGAFAPGAKRGDGALEVVFLVIDDIDEKVPEADVARALGRPTFGLRSSAFSRQWVYALSAPIPTKEWPAFFAGVKQLIGVDKLDGPDAVHVFRLPMGIYSNPKKPERHGFVPYIDEHNPGKVLDEMLIPRIRPLGPRPASGGAEVKLDRAQLEALMVMIPNDLSRDEWVEVGHGLKALCENDDEGFEVFDAWSQQHDSYDAGKTRVAWDSFGASGLRTKGGQLRARCEGLNPEAFKKWETQIVFDDGEVPTGPVNPKSAPHVLASGEFVEGFIPPDYLVKKLITKAFLYSLTGQTGAGKTSITLRLAATCALGRSFGGLGSKPCRVLYLAAENPVDIQMRWIALAAEMGFDVNTIRVFFVKGGFRISATMKELRGEAVRVGGDFGLVVVDTGPVFFEGEDANDRVAQLRHARIMRELIEIIPGKPAVIVNMHPVKNAAADNLQPSGGGSFLNEVDGNLTAAKNADQTIELHWQGKWRGVEFAPLHFLLRTVTHPRLVDSDGETMPTVVCDHLSTGAKEAMEQAEFADQGKMLAEMAHNPRASYAELAVYMGWQYFSGKPDKSKVQRYVKELTKQKLVKKHLQLWVVAAPARSKMNGKGSPTVSADTIRPDTVDTATY